MQPFAHALPIFTPCFLLLKMPVWARTFLQVSSRPHTDTLCEKRRKSGFQNPFLVRSDAWGIAFHHTKNKHLFLLNHPVQLDLRRPNYQQNASMTFVSSLFSRKFVFPLFFRMQCGTEHRRKGNLQCCRIPGTDKYSSTAEGKFYD